MVRRTGGAKIDGKERALLDEALEGLERTAAIKARRVRWDTAAGALRADALIEFADPLKAHRVKLKGGLTPARLGPILAEMRRVPVPNLLVVPYVSPPMAHRLRGAGVQFLDGEGNAYLNQKKPRIFVWVTGNRPPKPCPGERPLRVFRAAGLRVIFPFLCLPDAKTATYRDLARMAGVALGTVAKTIQELEHLGFLRKTKTHFVLENRERLLDAWADAYPRELRPLLKPRRFRTEKKDWWNDADWTLLGAWLGGEPAAALLTKHLRPVFATAYLAGGLSEMARALRLAKDDGGNVEVLQKFWAFELEEGLPHPRLVPPLLVYADLLATGEPRNVETAALIREQYLV